MKFLITLLFFFFSFGAKAQSPAQSKTKIYINEIGLTFEIPDGFSLVDSSINSKPTNSGVGYWKGYFYMKEKNVLSFSILRYESDNEKNWDKMLSVENNSAYNIVKNLKRMLVFDSSSTTIRIGNVDFRKFSMIGKEEDKISYGHIELKGFQNGYRVTVVYNFIDPAIANQIESELMILKDH